MRLYFIAHSIFYLETIKLIQLILKTGDGEVLVGTLSYKCTPVSLVCVDTCEISTYTKNNDKTLNNGLVRPMDMTSTQHTYSQEYRIERNWQIRIIRMQRTRITK